MEDLMETKEQIFRNLMDDERTSPERSRNWIQKMGFENDGFSIRNDVVLVPSPVELQKSVYYYYNSRNMKRKMFFLSKDIYHVFHIFL